MKHHIRTPKQGNKLRLVRGIQSTWKIWIKRCELYSLKQESFPLEQYISEFGKISLETYIDNAIKKDLFVNDLNGNLKIHLQLKQPHIYQEALTLAGGKSFVK